ncbi:Homeobox domain and Homeodomain-like-containing protein [Strongyloides ratti]|uniref:Homeobox domain and Homeodomain-like-containing protein n=1 Tax=Strongyloides ratti TaxID=34506 RepID=A0A090L3V0_STRRB|nr:Homeobox domain and Homeodomain-like-containing protein [Strongyloides ratti]CEF62144.1 Homeobox domain and Homeodomain-like-containing protein [Strongyloides ratti]
MTGMKTKFIIKPLLSIQSFGENFCFETEIERIVTINCNSMLQDVCNDVLKDIGLGHLSHLAKVSIKTYDSKYLTLNSFVPNLVLSIGTLKPIFGNFITIQIVVNGKVDDFSQYELEKTLCCNLLQLIIKKYSSIKDSIADINIKDIIGKLEENSTTKLPYEYLHSINKLVRDQLISLTKNKGELLKNEVSINDEKVNKPELETFQKFNNEFSPNLNTSSKNLESIDESKKVNNNEEAQLFNLPLSLNPTFFELMKTSPLKVVVPEKLSINSSFIRNRSRITFDQNIETPILEKWFSITRKPNSFQVQQIADHLNNITNRPDDLKITIQNVKIWFKNRRAKGKR